MPTRASSSTTLQLVGNGSIDLASLRTRLGLETARTEFERLVEDIVALKHPDVRAVRANPGDWGIDAFVGQLNEGGTAMVWQAKYFIDDFDKTQKDDITRSYNAARAAATREGYLLDSWTLCIPRTLDGPESKWWANWQRNRTKDGVLFDLMDEGEIRRRLTAPGAEPIRNYYFNPVIVVPSTSADDSKERPLHELDDDAQFDDALFVRQMEAARLPETRSAREAFFNAEILTQELEDKGVPAELDKLRRWRMRVDSTWSTAFNTACHSSQDDQLPGLFQNVMDVIEQRHTDEAVKLRASVIHGMGLMHQRVDSERAGWVRNWRDVAAAHDATPPTRQSVRGAPADLAEEEPTDSLGSAQASDGPRTPAAIEQPVTDGGGSA
ncbi:hypothetical protein [Pseudactinotalea suaedae]|uniref:hypothetical protein n=1 Tax=Pseudactinotalea suaedae TaxID=1524924 RepID=UPI0012E2A597|nr:hypothetical protein [Pseudactinotalea suaedae]